VAVAVEPRFSETAVKTHLLHLYAKLTVRDRASAVAAGYSRGLLL
jgi:ATP/maltotriose-dependent transcriptional regulator MalT